MRPALHAVSLALADRHASRLHRPYSEPAYLLAYAPAPCTLAELELDLDAALATGTLVRDSAGRLWYRESGPQDTTHWGPERQERMKDTTDETHEQPPTLPWVRIEADLESHPQAHKAGFWGISAFMLVIRICKMRGGRGILSPGLADPEYLADKALLITPQDRASFTSGLEAAVTAGLLERTASGAILIPGWRRYQVDPGKPARQARWRRHAHDRSNGAKVSDRNSHDM